MPKSQSTKSTNISKTTKVSKSASEKPKVAKTTKYKFTTTAKTSIIERFTSKSSNANIATQLHRLNALHVLVSVIGVVCTLSIMSKLGQQISTGLVVTNELAAEGQSRLSPAVHYLYEIDIRYALVAVLMISLILPLRNVLRPRQYLNDLDLKKNTLRWIDKAIVSGAMMGVLANFCGVQDFMTLKLVGAFMVITAMLGWLSERQNSSISRDWSAYGISIFTGMVPWLIVLSYSIGTIVWGSNNQSWFVYALFASVFAAGIAYALNGFNYIRKYKSWSDYKIVERNYVVIDILNRVAFATILIVGLHK